MFGFLKSYKFMFGVLALGSVAGGSYGVYALTQQPNRFQTPEEAVMDIVSKSSDSRLLRNKGFINIKPFSNRPSLTIFYTADEESKLEDSVSSKYDEKKSSFNNQNITKKEYGAWCDALYAGKSKNDSEEFGFWKENCSKDSSSEEREHINPWLKMQYPKDYYSDPDKYAVVVDQVTGIVKPKNTSTSTTSTTTSSSSQSKTFTKTINGGKGNITVTVKCGVIFKSENESITEENNCFPQETDIFKP